MKEERTKGTIKKLIMIILFIICITCLIYIIQNISYSKQNKEIYSKLHKHIENKPETEQENVNNEEQEEKNGLIETIKELKQENEDIKGWIQIENTNINYPLLQTTNNDYYLTHNYKKEKNKYGSICINSNCNINNENSNVIIYGHKMMQDDQMFGDLHKYKKESFYKEHPIIKIITEEREREYEIIYVFKSRIYYQDETNVFRYYNYKNFKDENEFNEYIKNCQKAQLYNIGKIAKYGEQLISLVTCEYSQENGRMVVVARRIK